MTTFDKHAAEADIAALHLEYSNAALAAYWLALWQGGRLPPRAAFNPAMLKSFLPGIVLFNVVAGESVTVRLAGTRIAHILRQELTGVDWIAAAPPGHRATRLDVYTRIARGAMLAGHRRLATTDGEDYLCEEIVLPFAPDANGITPVLAHAHLPSRRFVKIKSVEQAVGQPVDYRLVALKPAGEAAGQPPGTSAIIAA
ncbi:MAG TPA: PAS domain-containing protein [Rhizomicrobium sp.]